MDWFKGIAEKLRKAYEGMNPDSTIAWNAKKAIQQVDGLVQMWADMAVDAIGNYRKAEAVENNHTVEKDMLSERDKENAVSLVNQIRNDIENIKKVGVVSKISGNELNKNLRPTEAALDYINRTGNVVTREGFGEIRFSKTKIKSGFVGHGSGIVKVEAFAAVPDVLKNGIQIGFEPNWKGRMKDSYVFAAPISFKGEQAYLGVIVERDPVRNMYYVHEVVDSNGNVFSFENKKEESTLDRLPTTDGGLDTVVNSSEINVSQQVDSVKHSDRDSEGKELTEGQLAYFQNSKIRDADGNLMVMYRGGHDEFTVFDRKKSSPFNLYGRGFYFTNSEAHAKQYGNAKPFYLNITLPLMQGQNNITRQQMRKFIQPVADNEDDYGLDNYGYGATVASVLKDVWGKGDYEMIWDLNQTAIGDMVAAVELFNEVNGTDYDGLVMPTETVTFQSNQAKNIDNENPSADPDIRFSIREIDDGRMAAVVDDDILSHIDTATWDDSKIEAAKKAASSVFAKFSGGISVDGITLKVNKTSRREYTRSNYTESLAKKDKATFADKMRLADVADDVVTVTTGWQKDGGLLHQRKDNFVDFDHGHALLMAGENKYDAEVVVGIKDNGEYVFYDVVDIAPASFETKKEEPSTTATTGKPIGDIHEDSSKSIVAQDDGTVKHSDRDDYSTLTSKPDMTVIWTRFSSIPIMWKFI